MSMSIGLAAFPDDGRDADTLLSKADQRMYDAKNKKKAMLGNSALAGSSAPMTPAAPSLTTQ